MPINQKTRLVLKDLYSYDIRAAYPTIMGNMSWDFENIDLENKEERNVAIGKAQIDNPNLSGFLIQSAENLVNFYLQENNVPEDRIIVTQRDGFILTQMLDNIDEFIKMEFRGFIDFLVITPDRNKYLVVSGDDIDVKGVPHKYDALDKVYKMFAKLNFYDKKALFSQLQAIKDAVFKMDDKKFFMIPRGDRFAISTKRYETLEVQSEAIFSVDDIAKDKYYLHFFKEFMDSIFLEYY